MITRIFREEKALNPITYFNQNNPDYFKADYWRKKFDWHVTSVRAILNNEVYLGMLVYGKRRNKTMKSKQVVKNPPEEWIVVENCHEPTITQELWDTAHKVMSSKRRPAKTGELQIFAGLIYCAVYGHCLTYGQKQCKDGTYYGAYDCWMYRTHGKEYCPSHYINYDTVYNLVLINLRTVLWNYRNNAQQFKTILEKNSRRIPQRKQRNCKPCTRRSNAVLRRLTRFCVSCTRTVPWEKFPKATMKRCRHSMNLSRGKSRKHSPTCDSGLNS